MLGRLGIAISTLLVGMALGAAGADGTCDGSGEPSHACGKKSTCPAAQCGQQRGCSSCPFKAAGCCPKAGGCCAKDRPCDADCPKCTPPTAAEPCCPPPMPMAPPFFVSPAPVPPAPPAMPHPAYGPCPVAVMPHPFPPPPTPFIYPESVYPGGPAPWATPAPAPYYPVPHRAATPRQYVLEMRLLEGPSGKPVKGAAAPTVLFLEGQPCTISCQGWMSAEHGHGIKPAAYRTAPCCRNADCPHGCNPGCAGGAACSCDSMLRVRAVRREAGRVRLYLAFQQYEAGKSGKHGTVVYGKSVRAAQTVRLAHPTKIVLEKDADGAPHLWLEVKVKRAARHVAEAAAPCPTAPPCCAEGRACLPHPCCERLPAPACCHENHGVKETDTGTRLFGVGVNSNSGFTGSVVLNERNFDEKSQDEEIAAFWNTLAEMICGRCPLMQSSWAETTVPSGHYFPYPLQCFPPAPAFPLSRELTYQQEVAAASPPSSGIRHYVTVKSVPAGIRRVCVVEKEGQQCLELIGDELHCCSKSIAFPVLHGIAPNGSLQGDPLRLTVEAGQVCLRLPNLTATADRLTTGPKGHIVLKGNVRVERTGPSRRSVMVGDCIDIDLSDGSIRIESKLEKPGKQWIDINF